MRSGMVGFLGAVSGGAAGADPYREFVVSHLHFDGADGSSSFVDTTGRVWTAVNGAQIDDAFSVFGGSSGFFNTGNALISTPASADFAFGTGDFTVELFFRRAAYRDASCLVGVWGNTPAWLMGEGDFNPGALRFGVFGGSASFFEAGTAAIITNQFCFLSASRVDGVLYLHSNGVLQNSFACPQNITNTAPLVVGSMNNFTGYNVYGHADELRITKGVGRYGAADYAVPSGPFSDF